MRSEGCVRHCISRKRMCASIERVHNLTHTFFTSQSFSNLFGTDANCSLIRKPRGMACMTDVPVAGERDLSRAIANKSSTRMILGRCLLLCCRRQYLKIYTLCTSNVKECTALLQYNKSCAQMCSTRSQRAVHLTYSQLTF